MLNKILSGIIVIAFGYIFTKMQLAGHLTNLFDKILGSLIPTMLTSALFISNRYKYKDFKDLYPIDYIALVVIIVCWALGTLLAVDKMFGLSFMR